ncbi:MAG TPA: ATP-binding cassette domain-containing protein, partial [Actinomycetota bacterium]
VFSSHQLELVERLCEAVAIIDHGRLVASGRVTELRAAGAQRRYRVGVVDSPNRWWSELPGVRPVDGGNGQVMLELDDGVDEQGVLDAARRAGRVTYFSSATPTLADLFRKVVSS